MALVQDAVAGLRGYKPDTDQRANPGLPRVLITP